MTDFPALKEALLPAAGASSGQRPRFLMLYGSTRPGSFSHLLCEEVGRLLERLGGEVKIFDSASVPPGAAPDHASLQELRKQLAWSDGQFWCSPENFGSPSAVLKGLLEGAAPFLDGVNPFAGKPLAVAQVTGAAGSFNTTNSLAIIGRWLGALITSTQMCVTKVQEQFDENKRMKASPDYDRLVDLAEELFKLTALTCAQRADLLNRYSVRVQKG